MLRSVFVAVLAGTCASACLAQTVVDDAQRHDGAQFCVVPVKDGAPTEADFRETWRISRNVFRIPGLPAIVFTPTNRKGQWTIDTERRLVPYNGPYPRTYLDKGKWVREPWSTRIVAVTFNGDLSVLRPGTDHFDILASGRNPDGRSISYGQLQVLPRRRLTVVVVNGAPFVVDEIALRPWLSQSDLAAHGIHGIYRLYDAPLLAATIIVDTDSELHVLTDDDRWFHIGNVDKSDYGRVFEARDAGAVVFLGQKSVVVIRRNGTSRSGYSAERLLTTRANGAGTRYSTSTLFHQVLTFDSGGIVAGTGRWRRLTSTGFEDVPGGDIGVPDPKYVPFDQARDLPTLGTMLIQGASGLFLYDGRTIRAVMGSAEERLDKWPRVHDLPSIGKVLVSTQRGLFELNTEGRLVERPMPFSTEGLPHFGLVDWPESGVALALSRDGLFALDADLKPYRVSGGEMIQLGWLPFANGTNPGTGEMVLTNASGLFLAIDSKRSPGVCAQLNR
ncbi:hypothetical protein MXD81_38775 [Microbacteriaceae bacterium K1510]|nr:hypothetical protein [Microbacteriaceae bacterium K1510]